MNHKEKLLKYLEEEIEIFSKLNDFFNFNMKTGFEIIKFCVEKNLFFNTLINIRILKNNIFWYIYEEIFYKKFFQLKYIFCEYMIIKNIDNIDENYLNKYGHSVGWYEFYKTLNKDHIDEKINTISKQLIDILESMYFNKKDFLINGEFNLDFINGIIDDGAKYSCKPIYFHEYTFNELTIDLLQTNSHYLSNEKKVANFIFDKLLENDEKLYLDFRKANLLANNAVHKTNYDSQDYEKTFDQEIYINEIDILENTIKTYIKIYTEFEKLSKKNKK